MINDADAVEGRTTLNVAQQQFNTGDSTAGSGLIVGGFGLGGTQAISPPSQDANLVTRTGFYLINPGVSTPAAIGTLMVIARFDVSSIHQIFFEYQTNNIWVRYYNGSGWSIWRPLVPEYGSNANGSYVKLADGTQICWRQYSSVSAVSWAAAFSAVPEVVATPNGGNANPRYASVISVSVSSVQVSSFTDTGGPSSIVGSVIGIGRWL